MLKRAFLSSLEAFGQPLILDIHFLINWIISKVIRPACGWQANCRYAQANAAK